MPAPHIVIVDRKNPPIPAMDGRVIMSSADYMRLQTTDKTAVRSAKRVINLCDSYEYLSYGYYCSLLADARGNRCIPSVSDALQLGWKRLYQSSLPELNKILGKIPQEHIREAKLQFYFGRSSNPLFDSLARRLFDLYRLPVIGVRLKQDTHWQIRDITPLSLRDIPEPQLEHFNSALNEFSSAVWKGKSRVPDERFWLAVLHDPKEKMPPSNKRALQKFVQIGKRLGIYVELITRHDLPTLLEFDALFIRETTAINNHTFRFALKAESEGLVCIDDSASMIRCGNKVFLHDLLQQKQLPTPKTWIIDRRHYKQHVGGIPLPVVIKVPDGSFSRAVFKAETSEALQERLQHLFEQSDILLLQEFMPSAFDWRVGVLGGKALYACQYFMAKGHWQTINHERQAEEGGSACVALEDVPPAVLETAVAAARLVGDGFYGVDVKQDDGGKAYIIEINDNPNIDAGVEDALLGDRLYEQILLYFDSRVNADTAAKR